MKRKKYLEHLRSLSVSDLNKLAQDELLKHVTTNFDFYKVINDNEEAKEEFNTMVFNMVKEMLRKSL